MWSKNYLVSDNSTDAAKNPMCLMMSTSAAARQNKTVIIQRSLSMTLITIVIESARIVGVYGDQQRIVSLPWG